MNKYRVWAEWPHSKNAKKWTENVDAFNLSDAIDIALKWREEPSRGYRVDIRSKNKRGLKLYRTPHGLGNIVAYRIGNE